MNKLIQRNHVSAIVFLWQLLGVAHSDAQNQPAPEPHFELSRIGSAYEITFAVASSDFTEKTTHGLIEGKLADGPDFDNYIGLFVPEFTLYPTALVKRAQLKKIVLCNDLYFAGQRRGAIPDFEHDTLYLDVSRGSKNKLYLRKVLHHEFFHIIDYRDDGWVYRDERWSKLNATNFRYGDGGRNAQTVKSTAALTDKFPGFLNHYSTTGVEEDKAELFANLICETAYIDNRLKDDAVLTAKVTLLKNMLSDFCPEVNAAFWEKSKQLDRTTKATTSASP